MKQLYLIGILVAVVLLALFGISKLTAQHNSTVFTPQQEATTDDTMTPPTVSENGDATLPTRATLKTNKGDIELELFAAQMPVTVGNFVTLARDGFYNGITFHRVIDGFMIQAGDPQTKDDALQAQWGTGGPGYTIEDEFVDGLSNVRGTFAMANTGQPNSGGSQFFINLVDNTGLDFDKQPFTSKHPVFAKVVSGVDVVDVIGSVATGPHNVPIEPVVIEEVVFADTQ